MSIISLLALELDSWCKTLKLGCEFPGIQHSQYPNPVHTTRAQFEAQAKRDVLKQRLCSAQGVCLVLVRHTVTRQEMIAHLESRLRELGFLQAIPPPPAAKSPYEAMRGKKPSLRHINVWGCDVL